MSGAVAVVEQVLGVSIVDGNNGELQHAFLGHCAQADDAGGRFLGSADHAFKRVGALGVQNRDEIGAVVHRNVRLVVDGGQDVVVIRVVVLALDGKHRNVVIADKRCGNIILGRKRIRGAEDHFGSAVAQADRKIRGLGRDVQAGRHSDSGERLVLDEFLTDDLQHLHGLVRPLDAFLAQIGQFDVLNIAIHCCC